MNFEHARLYVPPTLPGSFGDFIDPALAFAGWMVGGSNTVAIYNNASLGAPAVGLIGPDFPNALGLLPLEGSYSVSVYWPSSYGTAPPTLTQTGLVPFDAKSITILVSADTAANWVHVTLGGVDISLTPIAGGRLAGDVSAFAGQTVPLSFSASSNQGYYFDDVRFSSLLIPEPSSIYLTAMGVIFIAFPSIGRIRVTR